MSYNILIPFNVVVIHYQVVGRDPAKLTNFTGSDLYDLKGAIKLEEGLSDVASLLKLSVGKPGGGKYNLYDLDDDELEDEGGVFNFRTLCSKYKIGPHNPILVELPGKYYSFYFNHGN